MPPKPSFTATVRSPGCSGLESSVRYRSPASSTEGTPRMAQAQLYSRNSEQGIPFSVTLAFFVVTVWDSGL